jgi:hypothetical protein
MYCQLLDVLLREAVVQLANLDELHAFAHREGATTYVVVLLFLEVVEAREHRAHQILVLLVGTTNDARNCVAGGAYTLHLGG